MVDRYGAAIEADFHREYSLDLIDFFRGKFSWRKLNGLLQRLPSSSLLREAMGNDDEIAEQILAVQPETPRDTGPRLSEYSPESQRLDDVKDLLHNLAATVVSVAGGKPRPSRPAKRPETAFTRAREAKAFAKHNSLVDEVTAAQARWAAKNTT